MSDIFINDEESFIDKCKRTSREYFGEKPLGIFIKFCLVFGLFFVLVNASTSKQLCKLTQGSTGFVLMNNSEPKFVWTLLVVTLMTLVTLFL